LPADELAEELRVKLEHSKPTYYGLTELAVWSDDDHPCATIEFVLEDIHYILDIWWMGYEGVGAFYYAHDSLSAQKRCLDMICFWIDQNSPVHTPILSRQKDLRGLKQRSGEY
jgi:hypothetical protein